MTAAWPLACASGWCDMIGACDALMRARIRMAQRKKPIPNGPGLFEAQERQLERRLRRQRALFIPRFLRDAAKNFHLDDVAQDQAYKIAVHWADLESKGHLPEFKETSIDTQFLDHLFG